MSHESTNKNRIGKNLPEKFDNRWHNPRLILVATQMFSDLQNRGEDQRSGARVVESADQLRQDLVLANLRRYFVQLFRKSGEKSGLLLVVLDLDLLEEEEGVDEDVLEVAGS